MLLMGTVLARFCCDRKEADFQMQNTLRGGVMALLYLSIALTISGCSSGGGFAGIGGSGSGGGFFSALSSFFGGGQGGSDTGGSLPSSLASSSILGGGSGGGTGEIVSVPDSDIATLHHPEPASLMLFGGGLAGLAWSRRRNVHRRRRVQG